jgi:transposase
MTLFTGQRGLLHVQILSPTRNALTQAYRNRERLSGAHDDDTDADLLSSIMVTDRATHRRLQPNLPLTQQMLGEMRLIETLRRSIQRQTNQLQAALYRTYPQAVGLFSDLTCQITLEFLSAYPTAPEAHTLSAEAFEAFLRQHGYKRLSLIPIRYAHLVEAMPQASPAVIDAHRDLVRTLAQVLLPQVKCRMFAIETLHRLFQGHPDAFIFQSLPVQGELLPPSLLVKFGDHRDRFPCAGDVQALAGTCPATAKSGQRRRVYFRQACDKEFRRIIQQFARLSIGRSGWALAYYHDIRPHCHSDSHAIRILANRWLAILWKLWSTRQTYDEAYHLQQRARRRRPLA